MDPKNDWCEKCVSASTCTKNIVGYQRVSVNEVPYGKTYDTESEAWDTGNSSYSGEFEVFPKCR